MIFRPIPVSQWIFAILFASARMAGIVSAGEDAIVNKVKAIAEERLQEWNSIDGIEHVGGPFLFKDYVMRVNRFQDGTAINFNFQYKRPNGIEGRPDSFCVTAFSEKGIASLGSEPPYPPLYLPYRIIGEVKDEDLLKILPRYCRAEPYFPERNIEIAFIQADNQVTRRTVIPFGVSQIQRIAPDEIQIQSGFPFLQVHGPILSFLKSAGRWWPASISDRNKKRGYIRATFAPQPLIPLPQTVQIRGHISDAELIQVVNEARSIRGLAPKITSIIVQTNLLYIGTGDYEAVKPHRYLTFRKQDQDWILRHVFDISGFSEWGFILGFGLSGSRVLPLLPKLDASQIDAAREKIHGITGKLTDGQITKILELILRIPGIEHCAASIRKISNEEVEVWTGAFPGPGATRIGGEVVRLKYINDVWVILKFAGRWNI